MPEGSVNVKHKLISSAGASLTPFPVPAVFGMVAITFKTIAQASVCVNTFFYSFSQQFCIICSSSSDAPVTRNADAVRKRIQIGIDALCLFAFGEGCDASALHSRDKLQ